MKTLLIILAIIISIPALSQVKINDSTYVINESDWRPNPIFLKDSVKTFRLVSKNGFYAFVYVLFSGSETERIIEIRQKKYVAPVIPKPDLITDIDDKPTDTRNKYILAWSNVSGATWNANHFGKSASFTSVKDGALETTFDGYKVEWFTEKRINHGIAAVSIDGGTEVMIDLYDPRTDNNKVKVWTSPTLTNGTHKIKIRCTLTKNTLATDTNIIHDFFKVYKKQ
jgi:hypothetical protein